MKINNISKALSNLSVIAIILQPLIGMTGFYAITFLEIGFVFLRILKYKKIMINSYDVTFITFIFLAFVSKLYAISQQTANYAIKELIISYMISFSIGEYINQKDEVNNEKKIITLFDTFTTSTTIMSIYLLIFDLPRIIGTRDRLGRLLFDGYGTYIVFSYSLIIALCFLIWKIIYIKKTPCSLIELMIIFITSCLSGTRKVLVCFAIFSIFIFLYKYRKNALKTLRFISICAICIVLLYKIIITNQKLYKIIGNRIENMIESVMFEANVNDASINERNQLKTLAFQAFKEKPILGWGVNNFANYSLQHSGPFLYAHCNYLELLSTLGIIGTILYYSGYLWLIIKAFKHMKENDKVSIFILFFLIMNLFADYETVSYSKIHYILIFVIFAKYLNKKEVTNEVNYK